MPAAGVRVVRDLDELAWWDFVDRHPHGNIFHTPLMREVFARAPGHEPEVWAALGAGGRLLALMTPVRVNLTDGVSRWFTTRRIAYGGVLHEDSTEGCRALGALLESCTREAPGNPLFTEIRNLHDLHDLIGVLRTAGYAHEGHLTYLIDLDRPPQAILQGMRSGVRKDIRRGLRNGHVRVVEVQDPDDLAGWYAVLERTYRNAGVPLAGRGLFEAALGVLLPVGMVRFTAAMVGEGVAACSAELHYRDRVYGWYGGTDRAYSRYTPNEILTWRILEWATGQGYRIYDFGGAGRPGQPYGVRDFKAKFGGRLVDLGRFVHVHAPYRLGVSRGAYAVYRRLLAQH